jgi:hypothetical protein
MSGLIGAGIAFTVLIIVSMISVHYLGPDNAVEKEAEILIEDELEDEFGAEKGSLKPEIDKLFPHKK